VPIPPPLNGSTQKMLMFHKQRPSCKERASATRESSSCRPRALFHNPSHQPRDAHKVSSACDNLSETNAPRRTSVVVHQLPSQHLSSPLSLCLPTGPPQVLKSASADYPVMSATCPPLLNLWSKQGCWFFIHGHGGMRPLCFLASSSELLFHRSCLFHPHPRGIDIRLARTLVSWRGQYTHE
jgi:hypothetical protein